MREKNAAEQTATANKLAEDEKGRIKEVEAVRTEAQPTDFAPVANEDRASAAEARYAYDNLSNGGKLKATQSALETLERKAKKEGWTEENRVKRIDLMRQRDGLTKDNAPTYGGTVGKGGAVSTDDSALPKGKDLSRLKLGGGVGSYRAMYDERIHARRDAMGVKRDTFDLVNGKFIERAKDGKRDEKKNVDAAILSTDKNIARIADVLAG